MIISTRLFRVRRNENAIVGATAVNKKDYAWSNTHQMLGMKGVIGGKTGITQNAGPCLTTVIQRESFVIVIVILCSKSMDSRWCETSKLVGWAYTRLRKI